MKTKALISFAVTAKLICTFVFAYADCLFSGAAGNIIQNTIELFHEKIFLANAKTMALVSCAVIMQLFNTYFYLVDCTNTLPQFSYMIKKTIPISSN